MSFTVHASVFFSKGLFSVLEGIKVSRKTPLAWSDVVLDNVSLNVTKKRDYV